MRKREKLTPEERFSLALELVKRERSFEEICLHYQVSHTTAYKIRNAFLDGGRRALAGARARLDAEPDGTVARAIGNDHGSALAPDTAGLDASESAAAVALHDHDGDHDGRGLAASEAEPRCDDDDTPGDCTRR